MKRWYLYPFSVLYGAVVGVRNVFYNVGIFRSTPFKTPIICVGNLSVGGSGKSPMVMYLANLLSKEKRTGVLSRGYGRQTKGYVITGYESNYKMVGDEAMQLFQRFKNKFVIGVSENRVEGARKMIHDMNLEVLLLDDAYQHRAIKAGFNILMTDFNDPYFKDYLLPAGDLREARSGAKRANIVMVSKCPNNLSNELKIKYSTKIKMQNFRTKQVFFSSIQYDEKLVGHSSVEPIPDNNLTYYDILLVTGIANPTLLLAQIAKFNKKIKHLKFKDHHNFSISDIKYIQSEFKKLGEYKMILTTEKDFVRLKSFNHLVENLYYWPINVEIDKKEEFNQLILDYVRKN